MSVLTCMKLFTLTIKNMKNYSIDCSNGSGLFVRFIIAYVMINSLPICVELHGIRNTRPNPGINDQLLSTLIQLRRAGYIKVGRLELGQLDVTISNTGARHKINMYIKTRGSSWLVLQMFLVPLLVLGGKITIDGNDLGCSSPTYESLISMLKMCNMLKYYTIQRQKGKITVSANKIIPPPICIKSEDIFDNVDYHLSEDVREYFLTKDNIFSLDTDDLMWQWNCKEQIGYTPYFVDQWFVYVIFFGGYLEIPTCLFEKNPKTGDYYDTHFHQLLELMDTFVDDVEITVIPSETPNYKITILSSSKISFT